MNLVSFDLETLGLDPATCDVLQLAMVLESTKESRPVEELPFFVGYVAAKNYRGEPFAMSMHAPVLHRIATGTSPRHVFGRDIPPNGAVHVASDLTGLCAAADAWLDEHFGRARVTAAGKNLGRFDFRFLPDRFTSRFHHRLIDPGSVFVDWSEDHLPSLDELMMRLGVGTPVQHDALDDARDVVRVLRCAPGYRS